MVYSATFQRRSRISQRSNLSVYNSNRKDCHDPSVVKRPIKSLTEKHQNDRISPQEPVKKVSHSPKYYFNPRSNFTHILLINRSLLTGLPFLPALVLGVSVHISFTFSSTILQCLSNAFTRASSFRLLRHDMRTCVCDRTAVWRIDRGPEVNSCSSSCAISYSL
jgi:hypothetical protein